MDNTFDLIVDEESMIFANYSNAIGKINEYIESNLRNAPEFANKSLQNLLKLVPLCVKANPYVLNNDGWIPEHIWIASHTWYTLLAIYMSFLTVLSCILNGVVVVATMKYKALRQPLNYVIVNLAFADLLAGIIGGIIVIPTNCVGYFFWGKAMCLFEGYMISIFSLAGLNTIAVMAFERFFVVCKPFGNIPFGHKASMAGLAITWVWSFLWNTPSLIVWDGYQPEGLGTSCAPNWYTKEYEGRIFIALYFVFCFMLPLAVIVVCYGALIVNLRKIAKQSSISGSKSPEGEVSKMVILMVSAFLVAWLPYAGFGLYNVLNPDSQFRDHVIRMFCNGKNPWSDELGLSSTVSSQIASQVTTIGTNKVAPA